MHVESSAIRDIGYDDRHGKLLVRFSDGDLYVYVGVPGEVHRSFVEAESKGRYFSEAIRNRYPFNKCPEGAADC
jgi:hypothetical protein